MDAIDFTVSIVGVASALQLLPEIVRVLRRKSSDDFSMWSLWMGFWSQAIWLAWAIYRVIPVMIVAGVAWQTMIVVHMAVIWTYRGKRGERK